MTILRCDKCGWEIAKDEYDGQGECFKCAEAKAFKSKPFEEWDYG